MDVYAVENETAGQCTWLENNSDLTIISSENPILPEMLQKQAVDADIEDQDRSIHLRKNQPSRLSLLEGLKTRTNKSTFNIVSIGDCELRAPPKNSTPYLP